MIAYRIAIVGPREAVAGFALLGADVIPAHNQQEALAALFRLKREIQTDEQGRERPKYAILLVSEDLVSDLSPDDERKLARGALPAITPIPSHKGIGGYGQQRLKHIVERAIGSDILT